MAIQFKNMSVQRMMVGVVVDIVNMCYLYSSLTYIYIYISFDDDPTSVGDSWWEMGGNCHLHPSFAFTSLAELHQYWISAFMLTGMVVWA